MTDAVSLMPTLATSAFPPQPAKMRVKSLAARRCSSLPTQGSCSRRAEGTQEFCVCIVAMAVAVNLFLRASERGAFCVRDVEGLKEKDEHQM